MKIILLKMAFMKIAAVAILYAISWAICTGLIYLICLCFSWKFSILAATGIWLVICLIKGVFSNGSKK